MYDDNDDDDDNTSPHYVYATNNMYGVLDGLEADDGVEPGWVGGTEGDTSEKAGTKPTGAKEKEKRRTGKEGCAEGRQQRGSSGEGGRMHAAGMCEHGSRLAEDWSS